MSEQNFASRTGFLWVGAVAIVVILATVTAFAVIALFGSDSELDPLPEVLEDPITVTAALPLRSAPAGNTAIAGRLEAGDKVQLLGRNDAGDWLLVQAIAAPNARGWIEASALSPRPDPPTVTVVDPDSPGVSTSTATATATAVTAQPTFTPDLPDLRVDSVFSRDNRVIVVVSNIGVVDVDAEIFVSVDGGDLHAADIKPGEPLRPDEQLEIRLDNEYVQRRAVITATVTTTPEIIEQDLDNNVLETVISPDIPNDLSISGASFTGPGGALQVRIRNNSTIPITGSGTLTVRDEERTRLGAMRPIFTLEPGAEVVTNFPEITELTIDEIDIRFSSIAVNDSDPDNDVFPR